MPSVSVTVTVFNVSRSAFPDVTSDVDAAAVTDAAPVAIAEDSTVTESSPASSKLPPTVSVNVPSLLDNSKSPSLKACCNVSSFAPENTTLSSARSAFALNVPPASVTVTVFAADVTGKSFDVTSPIPPANATDDAPSTIAPAATVTVLFDPAANAGRPVIVNTPPDTVNESSSK